MISNLAKKFKICLTNINPTKFMIMKIMEKQQFASLFLLITFLWKIFFAIFSKVETKVATLKGCHAKSKTEAFSLVKFRRRPKVAATFGLFLCVPLFIGLLGLKQHWPDSGIKNLCSAHFWVTALKWSQFSFWVLSSSVRLSCCAKKFASAPS